MPTPPAETGGKRRLAEAGLFLLEGCDVSDGWPVSVEARLAIRENVDVFRVAK